MMLRLLLGGLCVLLACQCASKTIVYTPPDWPAKVHADLHPPAVGKSRPAPVVILIHGGGWFGPDRRWQMFGIARKLTARGYYVMNVSYRMPPGWTYPAPVDDLGKAIDWLNANAVSQNIDPSRIALFGYSAGGHLALLRGLEDHRVKAIVAGAAPADLMWFEGGKLVEAFLGGTRREYPERYRLASPVVHVRRTSPPVFLYHGSADRLVPAVHARKMKAALDRDHVPSELFILSGRSHVGSYLFGAPAEAAAIDFLDRVFQNQNRFAESR